MNVLEIMEYNRRNSYLYEVVGDKEFVDHYVGERGKFMKLAEEVGGTYPMTKKEEKLIREIEWTKAVCGLVEACCRFYCAHRPVHWVLDEEQRKFYREQMERLIKDFQKFYRR